MSFSEQKFWRATCDLCAEDVATAEVGFSVYESREEAIEEIRWSDGEVSDDGKITCPSCVEERRMAASVGAGSL